MTSPQISLACIGGHFAKELLQDRKITGTRIGCRKTPFGTSQPVYLCKQGKKTFYLLLRHDDTQTPLASSFANHRANIYALKDMDVTHIVSWSGARAISHNYRIGQLVLVDDLIDETRHRPGTFFEQGMPLDWRQWPVFCPTMRTALSQTLQRMELKHTMAGTYLCSEGPRRETCAEVRKYTLWGADLLGHGLAPEAFLAKELQICYASLCFVTDFAETGSVRKPFDAGCLFSGQARQQKDYHPRDTLKQIPEVLDMLPELLSEIESECSCQTLLAPLIDSGALSSDFHDWFRALTPMATQSDTQRYTIPSLQLPSQNLFSEKAKNSPPLH